MAARGERRPRAHNMLEVLLRERGDCFDSDDGSDEYDENAAAFLLAASQHLSQCAPHLLVVFDMDHTMVGDLVSLSDRDNVETNMPWSWWPDGKGRGLSPACIVPYLQRGMMRPGMPELLAHLQLIGATIVVYTHSEDRWAVKVCQAMERLAGWPFIHRVFSRMDCKDGHPEFKARKSLAFIVDQLKTVDGLDWAEVDNTIMFDDDCMALPEEEKDRLVTVTSYDHWAKCSWDENVNEEMLARNPEQLAQIVRASVVQWGIAPPSYSTVRSGVLPELTEEDLRWAKKMKKKEALLLAFNQVAQFDRVMYDVLDALMDLSDLKKLPQKVREHLAKQKQPQSRRLPKQASVSSSESNTPSRAAESKEDAKMPESRQESPAKAAGPSPPQPAGEGAAFGPETLPVVDRIGGHASRSTGGASRKPAEEETKQADLRTDSYQLRLRNEQSYEMRAPGPVSLRSDSVSPVRPGGKLLKGLSGGMKQGNTMPAAKESTPTANSERNAAGGDARSQQIQALLLQQAALLTKLSRVCPREGSTTGDVRADRSSVLASLDNGPRRSMAQ